MKVLIVTTSRADWNGLGMVARELIRREIGVWVCAYTWIGPDWADAIQQDVSKFDYGNGSLPRAIAEYQPDVAVVAGDRSELLEACVTLCRYKVPICHIGGGDITEGSMDDRYRDAITALATIHCAETKQALMRLNIIAMPRHLNSIYLTGYPGLDRIRQIEPVAPPIAPLLSTERPNALLIVHPNTVDGTLTADADACISALLSLNINTLPLEANKDRGGEFVNARLFSAFKKLISNRPPAEFYWLLQHCDVLVGNSSAGCTEAPSFGIPVVNVGDRQKGRQFSPDTLHCQPVPENIRNAVQLALRSKRPAPWRSPYGDGESAPRIVKAIEDNAWRWNELRR